MPKKSALVTSDTSEYSGFLKGVKLFGIGLDQVSSTIDRERYWECREKKNGIVRSIESAYKATDIEDKHFDVVAHFELKFLGAREKRELLRISCQYSSHFHAKAPIDERLANKFANAEAKIIIWPYFRQLVNDLSARMYIPPIIVPFGLDPE